MKKIFRYVLTFFFVINSIYSSAQKPMDMNFLNSKLDSIVLESKNIYNLLKSKIVAEKIAEEQYQLDYNWILEVKDTDSIHIKFIDSQKAVIAKMTFYEDFENPIVTNNTKDKLSNFEDSLFRVKYTFLSKMNPSEFGIESHDSEKVITIIFPYMNKYKLYRILSTEKKNVIPFGNDFLFILNSDGNVLSWNNFHKTYVPMKTVHHGYKVGHIIPKYYDNETFILATDIALFRLFTDNLELSSFTANPPKSSRYFTYDSKSNSLRVHTTLTN